MEGMPFKKEGVLGPRALFAEFKAHRWVFIAGALCFLSVFGFFYYTAVRPPSDFPSNSSITISPGATLSGTAALLQRENVIRSPFWFSVAVRLLGGEGRVTAGDYFLGGPENVLTIARRVVFGAYGFVPERITIPEGSTNARIASLLSLQLPKFDAEQFKLLSAEKEGYLFPDTYFFLPHTTAADAVAMFESNFRNRIAPVQDAIASFGKPLSEVVTMASLIEREAPNTNDRRIIAGILWKRLAIGMPLQVDAAFSYVNGGKPPASKDFSVDSPYNTYLHRGLPPTPICNPGLDAITAAVTPVATDYFYYLSDKTGAIHYAVTFDEHKANKKKYLR